MPKFAPVANPKQQSTESKTTCFHCGEVCNDHEFHLEDKYFCCFGCKTVYEILRDNDLLVARTHASNESCRITIAG
mgnify:CR=1 FL=1